MLNSNTAGIHMMEYQERGNYSVVYFRDLLSRGFILLECSAELEYCICVRKLLATGKKLVEKSVEVPERWDSLYSHQPEEKDTSVKVLRRVMYQ